MFLGCQKTTSRSLAGMVSTKLEV
ncbi:hypothetical protein NC653_020050 [Populus alba x Populus x berolinensis]|uniref:Uncharacterized protein n=1 Tax=Populus alba x Populus x berolinensis TaxID=444605 RepID=A0AAD6MJM5_9ROSI|nr:hypothetical protein NC653_020045 [Populus alba x Populus x berolinensis]KAJ6986703.1 hypothetical protein NC653_020050 [Populus alba x Populus x berolinensis]